MKNGDRVTGIIVKQDGKTITVKTENFGTVTAAWDQVSSIQSDQPVNVVLKDGKTLVGTVSPSQGKVEVTTKEAKVDVSPGEVATIRNADEQNAYERLLHPGFFELWSGTGSLGWAGTNGNAKTLTFTTAVRAARVTNTDKTSIYFGLIKASALVNGVNSSTAQAVRGGLGYDHNVSPRLFVNLFNDYEYDRFQNLDLRFVIGGGLGFHAVKTERSLLDLLAGADYNRSSFSTPLTRNSAEAFWGDEYTLNLTAATSLVQSFRMFNNLSDTGAYPRECRPRLRDQGEEMADLERGAQRPVPEQSRSRPQDQRLAVHDGARRDLRTLGAYRVTITLVPRRITRWNEWFGVPSSAISLEKKVRCTTSPISSRPFTRLVVS